MELQRLILEQGMHRARKFVNRMSRRNASRILRKFSDFLPVSEDFEIPNLAELYQHSVARQLQA